MIQASFHPFLQVRTSHAGYAGQRGFKIVFADFQDAFRIDLGLSAELEHGFVAGALALLEQP